MSSDWDLPESETVKISRTDAIAAIVECVINQFGEYEGLNRLCALICSSLVGHPNDSQHENVCRDWLRSINSVCMQRGILFDASTTCDCILTQVLSQVLGHNEESTKGSQRRLHESVQRTRLAFEDRISRSDTILAREMGIRID